MRKQITIVLLLLPFFIACSSSENLAVTIPQTPSQAMYFPPLTGNAWETKSISGLGWNQSAVQPLFDYLNLKHTKGFIIIVDGRIVMENYLNGHTADSPWYWASAGKTLTSAMTGIAQQQGLLSLNDKISDYLGQGWTNTTAAQENQILIRHLLTMSSGMQDAGNDDCVAPECLTYIAAPGTRWAYDNVYVKLQDVVASAYGTTWTNAFNTNLKNKIGMTGSWVQTGDLSVYWSTTRSMARFGLLMLNQGKWDAQQIIDTNYCNAATQPSQNINKAYGFLWWINGESSFHLPQSQLEFPGSIIPSGPSDMYMALGKNDQKIYVVPSRNMVVVRMGEAADEETMALSDFDDVLWQKINALYQ